MKCTNCGYENLPDMKFCGLCGVRLGRACATCSFINPPEHRFCGQCGSRLTEEPTVVERDSVPAQAGVQRLSLEETMPPPSRSMDLDGERRLATVILVDVAGSTDILEGIGTEAWVQLMNRVLQALEAEVYHFGGVVDQFRGDGLVAFFGAALAHEDDPERAVLAALAMHRAIEPFRVELAERVGMDLQLRVGVNTGEVIVASIGDDRHYSEDTIMGEAITLASRMETAAQPGTVLVTENTYHRVTSRFDWEPLGAMTLKGFSEPVLVYRPVAVSASGVRVHILQPHEPSALLIGREAEFSVLKDEVEKLRAGRGGIVMLKGETGMGKSSLVVHLRQHAVRDDALLAKAEGIEPPLGTPPPRSLNWLQARSRSYAQSSPYSLWFDLFSGWLDVRHGEPAAETRDRLRHQAATVWGAEWTEHYSNLLTLLSLPTEDTPAEQIEPLDAEGRRQQIFLTMRTWIKAIAQRGPLVLAFEDLHWADTTSLELLGFCLPLCDHLPLLWITVFRPERTSAIWDFQHRVETEYPHCLHSLTLVPLDEDRGSRMVDRLIGPQVLPEETRALLLRRAEGNPYFIEEFIHELIRDRVLEQDKQTGQWRATRGVNSLDLPSSLQNLLLARIDRLSPEERRVLQMASVIGSVFWSNVLQALPCDGASESAQALGLDGLKQHLTALQRAQLIHEHGRVPALGMEYAFESNLIRDAAYDGLLSSQRAHCHRMVADTLEQIFGEKVLARYYSLLAYHFRQAGSTRKELFYALLAAEEARQDYANVEAIEHYARALQLLDKIEAQTTSESQLHAIRAQRFEVLNGRRVVYYLAGKYAAGWADAQALLPLARLLEDDPVWLIDALLLQPGVGFIRSQDEANAGVPLAQQALAMARERGDRRREMHSLAAVARQRYLLNDTSWTEIGRCALEIARQLGDKRAEANILIEVGNVYAVSDPERSREYLETALPIIQDLDDKMAELNLLEVIGVQLESSVDYCRRLKECHEKQLQISREVGHHPAEAKALMFLGQIQSLYLGDYEGGLALLEDCRRMWDATPTELYPLLRIAQIRIEQGKSGDALAALARARHLAEMEFDDLGLVGLRLVSAIVYNALGDETHLRKALELTMQTISMSAENPQLSQQYKMAAACETAAAHLGLAQVLADEDERQHHLRRSLKSSQVAVDIYESYGFVRPIECVSEEILFRHSLALEANGNGAQADQYLQRAYDELMYKHDLIPADSHYRHTYLENIPLHRQICNAVRRLR